MCLCAALFMRTNGVRQWSLVRHVTPSRRTTKLHNLAGLLRWSHRNTSQNTTMKECTMTQVAPKWLALCLATQNSGTLKPQGIPMMPYNVQYFFNVVQEQFHKQNTWAIEYTRFYSALLSLLQCSTPWTITFIETENVTATARQAADRGAVFWDTYWGKDGVYTVCLKYWVHIFCHSKHFRIKLNTQGESKFRTIITMSLRRTTRFPIWMHQLSGQSGTVYNVYTNCM